MKGGAPMSATTWTTLRVEDFQGERVFALDDRLHIDCLPAPLLDQGAPGGTLVEVWRGGVEIARCDVVEYGTHGPRPVFIGLDQIVPADMRLENPDHCIFETLLPSWFEPGMEIRIRYLSSYLRRSILEAWQLTPELVSQEQADPIIFRLK
ncbi:MAG: hypothetical protein JWN64_442 [Parcubacteria group bacterium]|nr:hypothetical protein [Parcubacteria group bacterium]